MRHLRFSLAASLSVLALAVGGCGGGDSETTDNPPAQTGGSAGTGGTAGAGGSAGGGTGGTAGAAGKGGSGGTAGTAGAGGSAGSGGTAGTAGTGGSAPVDNDKDGADSTVDCDDNDATVNPSATEVCDGKDNNCDQQVDEGVTKTFYVDDDNDGFGVDDAGTNQTACTAPAGYVDKAGDCKADDAAINPGATEVCDNIDNNCTGGVDDGLTKTKYYPDGDKDTYGTETGMVEACAAPGENYATQTGDCDDGNASVNPGATEACDAVDNDCDTQIDEGVTTTYYVDTDADGFGVDDAGTNTAACTQPTGYAAVAGDCDNAKTAVNPGATEICDELDNDCDTQVDEGVTKNTYYPDTDKDGYGSNAGSVQGCTAPAGDWSLQGGDCDNNDAARFPGNTEVCDGKDNDCNNATPEPGLGTYYRDADNDTFGDPANSTTACALPSGYVTNNLDCNDASATVNPNAIEVCDNVDNNCFGGIDEGPVETWPDVDKDTFGDAKAASTFRCAADASHVTNNKDCNDGDKAINPDATEIPGNSIDENCDGTDTTAGTVCGHDAAGITQLPFTANNLFTNAENYPGNPAGLGFFWDDYEISTVAGQSFTALMRADNPATLRPRMYLNENSCGPTGFTINSGWYTTHPSGSYGRARQIVNNTKAGYYYQVLTSVTAGQTGNYTYAVIPGALGTSCGSDPDYGIWPLGFRETATLLTNDVQPAGTPVPTGYHADDFEFFLRANTTYTLLYGGMTFSERMYLAKAGACATSIATVTGGILNNGARHVYKPTADGIYAAYLSSTSTTATGNYTFNVVPGDVGESCFVGAGSTAGNGDSYVLYPLGGSVNQSLGIGDRVDAIFGTRFFDDYETWLEAGQSVTITMTTPSGGFVPRLRLASGNACTTSLATSTQIAGNTATITYTAPSAGVYVIIASSYATNQTGNFALATQYN